MTPSEAWIPPDSPDPHAILDEAMADAAKGRYELALAKHVWFHEHALEYGHELNHKRFSTGLYFCQRLGEEYQPAIKKLRAIRDLTAEKVLKDPKPCDPFLDFAHINLELEESEKTVDFFEVLERQHPAIAEAVYQIAQHHLIAAGRHDLCIRHIDPESDFANIIESYWSDLDFIDQLTEGGPLRDAYVQYVHPEHSDLKLHEDPSLLRMKEQRAKEHLTRNAATLVALLVVSDQTEKAAEIHGRAKAVWDDAAYHATLDKALRGEFPNQLG